MADNPGGVGEIRLPPPGRPLPARLPKTGWWTWIEDGDVGVVG